MTARAYLVVVDNNDYHQGEDFTSEDVKLAIQGDGCSPECETRSFTVKRIMRVEADGPL